MGSTSGIVLIATKCARADAADEWLAWYPEFVGSLVGGPVVAASTWALIDGSPAGGPGPGHSHVTRIDVEGELGRAAADLDARFRARHDAGDIHPAHGEIRRDVWASHGGGHGQEPHPSPSAIIAAEVLCTDPRRQAEWDSWYDAQHLPDMLDSGAFVAGSRWRRHEPRPGGANHLTVYEIAGLSLPEAVERSSATMAQLIAAGRKHDCHTGGLTMALERVG